jgi:hypothetical protein
MSTSAIGIPFLSGALFGNNLLNVSMMENYYQCLPPGPNLFQVYWKLAFGHPTKSIRLVSHSILQAPVAGMPHPLPLISTKNRLEIRQDMCHLIMGNNQSGCSVT